MENQESRSKWDELARQLGADVPAVDEPQPPSSKAATQEPRPLAKPLPVPPKRPASDWESLASELGVAPAKPAEPVEPEKKAAKAKPPQRTARPAPPTAAKRPRPVRPSEPAAASTVSELPSTDTAESAAPPGEPAPPPVVSVTAKDEPRQSGSISLWHRIFGSPEEQAKKIAEVSHTAEVVSPDAPAAERSEAEIIDEGVAIDRLQEAPQETAAVEAHDEMAGEAADRSRKRRPRRRRRGRGRKSDDQEKRPAEMTETTPDRDQLADEEGDEFIEEDSEETEPDLDDEFLEEPSPTAKSPAGRPKSASHRSIPSWEETIGVLVDLNMQARSQRKQSAPSSRGRPRGGRRRKKP